MDIASDTGCARLALACLDLTELGDACTEADVAALCRKAQGEVGGVAGVLPRTAAVCVWPRFVAQARAALPPGIAVAAVVNFPGGDEALEAVTAQVDTIRSGGGQEVDVVLPWRALQAGDDAACTRLLNGVRQASRGLVLKLILESGALDAAQIARASALGLAAGVDFLKTSTGKIPQGASLEAVQIMLAAMAADPRRDSLGLKPSGGIRTVADTRPYFQAVRDTLGDAALVPARFRIGASGLWNDIARVLGATAEAPAPGANPHY
ncbi:deoxyribose-phosphate aldolase [Amphibiibacter pelophylacis]|uniref:Deoxyribose-phosphate aldolase n=1 Tax=Amphibiibacter pelophylacis TaxID=1799477 RepID=A0ACC6P3H2_9BURK